MQTLGGREARALAGPRDPRPCRPPSMAPSGSRAAPTGLGTSILGDARSLALDDPDDTEGPALPGAQAAVTGPPAWRSQGRIAGRHQGPCLPNQHIGLSG